MANIPKYCLSNHKGKSCYSREVRSQKLLHFVNIARVCEAREIVLGVASSSPRAQGFRGN